MLKFSGIQALKAHFAAVAQKRKDQKSSPEKGKRHPEDDQIFRCDICSRSFATQWQLNAHRKRAHNIIEIIDCEECGLAFRSFVQLTIHKRFVHEKREKSSAEKRSKKFMNNSFNCGLDPRKKGTFAKFMRANTFPKPVVCSNCSRIHYSAHHRICQLPTFEDGRALSSSRTRSEPDARNPTSEEPKAKEISQVEKPSTAVKMADTDFSDLSQLQSSETLPDSPISLSDFQLFICYTCATAHKDEEHLARHMLEHPSTSSTGQISPLEALIKRAGYVEEADTSSVTLSIQPLQRSFKCPSSVCLMEFTSEVLLAVHNLEQHHEENLYSFDVCEKVKETTLDAHSKEEVAKTMENKPSFGVTNVQRRSEEQLRNPAEDETALDAEVLVNSDEKLGNLNDEKDPMGAQAQRFSEGELRNPTCDIAIVYENVQRRSEEQLRNPAEDETALDADVLVNSGENLGNLNDEKDTMGAQAQRFSEGKLRNPTCDISIVYENVQRRPGEQLRNPTDDNPPHHSGTLRNVSDDMTAVDDSLRPHSDKRLENPPNPSLQTPFCCRKCGEIFKFKYMLLMHRRKHNEKAA